MKKALSLLTSAALILAVTSAPALAYAHGGHGKSGRTPSRPHYALCTAEGCDEPGAHQHDGTWYCSNRDACASTNCVQSDSHHAHDGAGHRNGTGRKHSRAR